MHHSLSERTMSLVHLFNISEMERSTGMSLVYHVGDVGGT